MISRPIRPLIFAAIFGCASTSEQVVSGAPVECYELPGVAWDSSSTALMDYEPEALPSRVILTDTPQKRIFAEDGTEILGDFFFAAEESSIGYFEYSDSRTEVSWMTAEGDSVFVGRTSGFGGFLFRGQRRDGDLVGRFFWYTDSGMHSSTFALASLIPALCDQLAGRGT